MDKLKKVKVLYIDDFFKGGITDADFRLAFEIINARYNDKGLRTIISSEVKIKDLMKIVDEEDPVQKERYIDAFKWVWLDEQTFFNPFSIEAVFAYLCKLEMLQRWERLEPEKGKATFERIIDELRGEARVPAEFKV